MFVRNFRIKKAKLIWLVEEAIIIENEREWKENGKRMKEESLEHSQLSNFKKKNVDTKKQNDDDDDD